MEEYTEVVGNDANREDYLRIAAHFQTMVDHFRAGQFFHKAGEYTMVLVYKHECMCTVCNLVLMRGES